MKNPTRSRKPKDRQCNGGQKKRDKRTNNELSNTTQDTIDWIIRKRGWTQVLRKDKQFLLN